MNLIYEPGGVNGTADPTLNMFCADGFVHLAHAAHFSPTVVEDLGPNDRGLFVLRPFPTVYNLFYHQMCEKPRTFLNGIPAKVRQYVREGRVKILLYYVLEGDDLSGFGKYLYEALAQHGISPSQLIFVNGSRIASIKHQAMARAMGVEPFITLHCPIFQDHATWAYSEMPFNNAAVVQSYDEANNSRRPYLYLCLNRISRVHRLALLAKLSYGGMLGRGLWSNGYLSHDSDPKGLSNMVAVAEKEYDLKLPDIVKRRTVVDTDKFEVNLATSATVQADFGWPYAKTHLSLITETSVHSSLSDPTSMLFLTEKTFKTMANRHPFILWGNAYSLAELRKMGYETFSPWINEAYDEVEDHLLRLQMITEEIRRLSAWSQSHWDSFHSETRSIVEHNRTVLLNAPKTFSDLYRTLESIVQC